MNNKNLDKVLNNIEDYKVVPSSVDAKEDEAKHENKITDNQDVSYEKTEEIKNNFNNKEKQRSNFSITKNIGKVFDLPNDVYVQRMKDGKIFEKHFTVKILGIGGAGNNIIKYIYNSRAWPSFVTISALNTDYIALRRMPELIGNLFLIGEEELNGNGSGGDPEMGKRAAENDAETIKEMLKGTDILILVAGLGKGTGTGATPIIAEIAKELGILTIGLFNLPSIGAEGNKTYSNALAGLDKLSYVCSGFTAISNDRIIGADRERTSIKKAYEDANEYIREIVNEFIEMITQGSDVNIDFSDIKNFFNNQNGFLFLKVDISDYTKDAIKEAIISKIEKGYTDIDIINSENALTNIKINENVPSVILENTRNAMKEIVETNDLNIVNGISFGEKYENAEINILLSGKFELGKILSNKKSKITQELNDKELDDLIDKKINSKESISNTSSIDDNDIFNIPIATKDIIAPPTGKVSSSSSSSTISNNELFNEKEINTENKKGFFKKLFKKNKKKLDSDF